MSEEDYVVTEKKMVKKVNEGEKHQKKKLSAKEENDTSPQKYASDKWKNVSEIIRNYTKTIPLKTPKKMR